MKPDDLSERLLGLAVRVGKVVDALPDTRLGKHIAGQLVRSGTAPAPNYEKACAAESRRDFIHKVRIALKELRETRCWIKLIMRSELLSEARMSELANEADELCKILGQSLVTARKNEDRSKAKRAKSSPK
ncbi:four helix bundle protein [Stieleria mannarensis]|uniref:four helix bundle protein n=1 Tax=Stieleria mannarensis TaxID=2755585 RepID=UPI0015FF7326|nr:four helix bundle protein [Rhodopirellula sp. JC639]